MTNRDPSSELIPVSLPGNSPDASTWEGFVAELRKRQTATARYVIENEIGRGGMGVVHRAFDRDLGRFVALKIVRSDVLGKSHGSDPERTLPRFLEEAQITGQLDHPGIVPVHDIGVDPQGRVFFTMKLVEGEDLRAVFRRVRHGDPGWSLTRALNLMLRICEAVSYAHAKGVVHRDLKPGNVMVGRFGETYVMDWGLARVKDAIVERTFARSARRMASSGDSTQPWTLEGDVVGTPYFMPPEQARGETEKIGPQVDVYAIGAMLYQLIAGKMPFEIPGGSNTPTEVLARVLDGPPDRLETLSPETPAALIAIVEKAMERERENRYPSVIALADDLRAFLEDRVVKAHATGAIAELVTWIRRNRALAAAIAASLAVVAVLSAIFVHFERTNAEQQKKLAAKAQTERERVLRLADVKRLADLRTELETLWPARRELAPAMRDWLKRASELQDRLASHRDTLADLGRQGHVERGDNGSERVVFRDTETEWWYLTLRDLVADIAALCADVPTGATLRSMEQRLALAESIEQRSITEHRAEWDAAIAEIGRKDSLYRGLVIPPQIGLVPLGKDPGSGLLEFVDIATGSLPQRGSDGALRVSEGDGVVFVLLPGGKVAIGAQASDPNGKYFDPMAQADESDTNGVPLELDLDPFFLGKYELTQAQWQRMTGANPSFYAAGQTVGGIALTLTHPVERVSWDDCEATLRHYGFRLPSEAQWEYAARAQTSSPWYSGDDPLILSTFANLSDRYAKEHGGGDWTVDPNLEDGNTVHAPIGRFAPNRFGLHDAMGNVWEWCEDGYALYVAGSEHRRPGDGLCLAGNPASRVVRGGCFSNTPTFARPSFRYRFTPTLREERVGVRVARAIERGDGS